MKLEIRNNFDTAQDEAFGVVSTIMPYMAVLIDTTPGSAHVVEVNVFEDYGVIVDYYGVEEFDGFDVVNLTGDEL